VATQQDENTDEPGPESGEAKRPTGLTFARAVALFLLVVVGALVVLVLGSVLVIYATATAARRFGLPELHVTVVFLALLAILVVGYLGVNIAVAIRSHSEETTTAIEGASERIVDELEEATGAVVGALDELPAVVVDPRLGGRDPPAGPGRRPRRHRGS
jgi:hypothetical protein